MTRALLLAILDTLLPGDEGEPPLPSASQAGLDLAALGRLAAPLAAALGDGENFPIGTPADRVAKLRIVERTAPAAFKALLAGAIAAYYEAPPVLAALGWRVAPPQPHGHELPPDDEKLVRALQKVKGRGRLWRV